MSGGVYELWVTGLRAWGADPTTDLSHLPPLKAETFTPATYQRLIKHLNDAITAMMATWNAALNRTVSSARDDHEIARELVQLRALLARRLVLAKHPGFPTEISDSLWQGACSDILAIQQNLESGSTANAERGTSSRAASERTLALIRNNSFAAIVAPGYSLEELFAPASTQPQAEPEYTASAAPIRRRVVTD